MIESNTDTGSPESVDTELADRLLAAIRRIDSRQTYLLRRWCVTVEEDFANAGADHDVSEVVSILRELASDQHRSLECIAANWLAQNGPDGSL